MSVTDYPPIDGLVDEVLRELAASAAGLLLIHDARTYGLMGGGPDIDTDRCDEVMAAARERGLAPNAVDARNAAIALIAEWNRGAVVPALNPEHQEGSHA